MGYCMNSSSDLSSGKIGDAKKHRIIKIRPSGLEMKEAEQEGREMNATCLQCPTIPRKR